MRSVLWWQFVLGCWVLVGLARAEDQPPAAPKDTKAVPAKTILIYEVDTTQTSGDQPIDRQQLIKALRRRIDPADLYGITIRPAGKERIELILPTGVKGTRADGTQILTTDDVRRIKELIARSGSLEFRIVANGEDDKEAIEQARQYLENPKNRTELEKAQKQGTPPPPPVDKAGAKKAFTITLNKTPCTVTYRWIELGAQERRQLNLDHEASKEETRGLLWREAAQARKEGKTVRVPALGGALLYSRECANVYLPEALRQEKQLECFLLTRDPEKDAKGKPQAVSGALLSDVRAAEDSSGRPVVRFELNAEGARRFRELTRKNLPTGEGPDALRRHLAIVLDGVITSAPAIQAEIGAKGQISGEFTRQEVENLVEILRAGALPAPLKPTPVSETTVAPGGKKDE